MWCITVSSTGGEAQSPFMTRNASQPTWANNTFSGVDIVIDLPHCVANPTIDVDDHSAEGK